MKLRETWPLYAGMVVAGSAAVVASGLTLAFLASKVGWDGDTKWLLPAALDVGGASAGWAWLRPGTPDRARGFAAAVALSCLAASLAGNAIGHLIRTDLIHPGPPLVIAVGAVPAAVLAALAHLAALLPASPATIASVEATPDQPARATETPAPAASPDPVESTPIPPRVPSAGSDPKPDPIAEKAAGSTPPRSGVSATGADPIGAGGTNPTPTVAPTPTAPTGGQSAPDSANESGSSVRAIPADWTRPKGSDPTLISALVYAVDEEWLTRPLSETDVTALVVAGGKRARELRDQANASLARRDLERANITEHHEPTGVGSHD